MFIYNIKINGSKFFKMIFIGMLIILVIITCIVIFKIFVGAQSSSANSSCLPQNGVCKIEAKNYTNILMAVHIQNMDFILYL